MCRPLTKFNTIADDQGHSLTYDAWNRLIQVSASNGALITSYAYDAASRRIEEAAAGVHATALYYDAADQVLEEDTGAAGTTLQAQYVWSSVFVNALVFRDYAFTGGGAFQLNERVYVTQDANYDDTGLIVYTSSLGDDGDANADGTVSFADLLLIGQHSGTNVPGGDAVGDFNHDGNVDSLDVAILNAHYGATTSTFTWAVAIRFDYSAFGQVTSYKPDLSGTSVNFLAWDYGFQGGSRDPGTGLIYFENRDYSPTMMRWVQVDPIQSGMNWYESDGDNPINCTDATGLSTRWTVSNSVTDGPNVSWNFSYTATYTDDHRLELRPKVELWAGKEQARVIALIPVWEKAVEDEFNHWKLVLQKAPTWTMTTRYGKKIEMTTPCAASIPIFVRVKFSTSFTLWTEDQSVTVDGTNDRSDMAHFHLGDPRFGVTGLGVAHEVGHMLGLKDEYLDAVNYPNKLVLPADAALSIMNGPQNGQVVLDRQMQEILDYSHYKDHIPGTYTLARR